MSHVSSSASNTEGLYASTTIDAPAEGVFAVCEITSDSPHSRMTNLDNSLKHLADIVTCDTAP